MSGLRQRPENFRMNYGHSLAKGLVFAGLGGGSVGSLKYTDSSVYDNNCTMNNMDPKQDCRWFSKLGRFGIINDGSNDSITTSVPHAMVVGNPYSVCVWSRRNTSDTSIKGLYGISTSDTQIGLFYFYGTTNGLIVRGTTSTIYCSVPSYVVDVMTLHHYCIRHYGATTRPDIFIDGKLVSTTTGVTLVNQFANQFCFGDVRQYAYSAAIDIVDMMVYNRLISNSEIQQLADPSNVMLSSLILPPKRKYYGISIPLYTTKRYYKIGKKVLRAQ